jgi:hypothetical protein
MILIPISVEKSVYPDSVQLWSKFPVQPTPTCRHLITPNIPRSSWEHLELLYRLQMLNWELRAVDNTKMDST